MIGRNCRFLQGPETDPGTVERVRHAIADRRDIATEMLNYRKDGSTFWNALFISPVFDRTAQLVYFFASQLDVIRRRDAEEALAQAQKMEAVGQLTGGIAHDFNNLLQVIDGVHGRPEGRTPPQRGTPRLVAGRRHGCGGRARDGADPAASRLLAQADAARAASVNLNALVGAMARWLGRTLGDAIARRHPTRPGAVELPPGSGQAETGVLDIAANARDAMPRRRRRSRSRPRTARSGQGTAAVGQLPPGRYGMLAMTDTGAGMSGRC